MEPQEVKKQFTIFLILILAVAGLFAIKGFWDNRAGIYYSERLKKLSEKLDIGTPSGEKAEIEKELRYVQDKLAKHYQFPKLFFFFFIIIAVLLAIWDLMLVARLPQGSTEQKRCSVRMVLVLAVSFFVILCFFLLEYHKIVRFGWVLIVFLIQVFLVGISVLFGISENIYEHLMGMKEDEDLIKGPPPPAW